MNESKKSVEDVLDKLNKGEYLGLGGTEYALDQLLELLLSELPEEKHTWHFKHLDNEYEKIAAANAFNQATHEVTQTIKRLFGKGE